MANKPLPSQEVLRQLLRYEPETGRLFWLPRPPSMFKSQRACNAWNAKLAHQPALAFETDMGYLVGRLMRSAVKAHRVAWALAYGEWPAGDIDHINGIKSDNRLDNLRVVDASENMKNKTRYRSSPSGVTGVFRRKGAWKARISSGKTQMHLGTFVCLGAAIKARRTAEARHGFHPNHGRIS